MSTEEKIHSITGYISDSDKDLGQEKAERTTLDDETKQSDPTTIEQIKEKHISLQSLVTTDECQATSDSCKEQEIRVEKDCDNSSVSTIENRENFMAESALNPSQGQDSFKKQEKFPVPSTNPAETKEGNCGTEVASKITEEELKNQGVGKQTTTDKALEDSKKQVDEKENRSNATEEAKGMGIGGQMNPNPTTASKEDNGNNAELSEDVKKQDHRRWFQFLRPKEYKFPKKEEQKITESKKEETHYDIRHVNAGGSYLLAVGLMFVCVVIILGGFFWRIGYAIGGYHKEFLNATVCPTLTPSSNDSNNTHIVLQVLQKMWKNESDELVSK